MGFVIASGFAWATVAYLAIGLVFAVPFVSRWAGRLDEAAQSGTIGFRVMIFPGAVLLWPLLLLKLRRAR